MFTLITGSTAAVFEFVGIGYPLIMLAIGGAFTLLTMLIAFGEPLFGNWQIMRKCNRMLRAADQVEKRLGSREAQAKSKNSRSQSAQFLWAGLESG